MKARTFNDIRDAIYEEIVEAFPGHRVYDFGKQETFRGQDFLEIELPSLTYSLYLELDYSRVVDEYTEIDEENEVGRVTEMLPYKARITIGCHAEFQKEAEELSHTIHQHWGHAPCFDGIGCRLLRAHHSDSHEGGGVYSYMFSWTGWVRIAGRTQEAPLVKEVQYPIEVLPEGSLPKTDEDSESVPDLVPVTVVVFEVGEEPVPTG
jgi:hypothetical protein